MSIQVQNLKKNFPLTGSQKQVEILKDINFNLKSGETLAIIGHSGSGKSTLLSLLAGLDMPSSGEVVIDGTSLQNLNQKELTRFRAKHIGIIFQQFHLMPHLNALENVSLPLDLLKADSSTLAASNALQQVGLDHRIDHFPSQLSGGENQRVAIARALVTNPDLLLADEPTGNLDFDTGVQISDLMFNLVEKNRSTLILVTHNVDLAQRCDRVLSLSKGELIS